MERKVRDSCGKKRVQGRPHRREASRRLPDRPRKASAWSGNHYTCPLSEIRSPFRRLSVGLGLASFFGRSVDISSISIKGYSIKI
ncbi:hypothetical protein RCO48_23075 [Peribacillus frigoritolerans]|nr:hypothetical protein [Peribacillus frigoritolerans]